MGALCGEAVVFPKGNAPKHFFTIMKQRGAVFAKGRVPAVQFDVLFEDGLEIPGWVESNMDGILIVTVEDDGYEVGTAVQVTDADGNKAWSRAYFLDEIAQ